MKVWRIITVASLVLVMLAVLTSCNPLGGNKAQATTGVVEAVKGDLATTASGSGNISIVQDIKLSFGTAGRIARINVKEGSTVKKGDVLAELETDDMKFAVLQAENALQQAQVAVSKAALTVRTTQYALDQMLGHYTWPDIKAAQDDVDAAKSYYEYISSDSTKAGALQYATVRLASAQAKLDALVHIYDTEEVAMKRQELDLANQSLEVAKQSLNPANEAIAQAKRQLDKAVITAPFNGTVATKSVDVGQTVSATSTILYLVDTSSMELKVQVDEIDITGVRTGQKVTIELDALPGQKLDGTVTEIGVMPITQSGVVVYDVKIRFNPSPDSGIKPGMSATADVITSSLTGVVLVPDRAITRDSTGKASVEVVVGEGKTEKRAVTTGLSDGLRTEVTGGLKEGEKVIERRTAGGQTPTGIF